MRRHDDAIGKPAPRAVLVAQLAEQREVLVDETGAVGLVGKVHVGFDARARDLFAVERRPVEQRDRVALQAIADLDETFERMLVPQRVEPAGIRPRGLGRN